MEYRSRQQSPVTKTKRVVRRKTVRTAQNEGEETNRQRSTGGGGANELGVTQGQNGEQGNTFDPAQSTDIGRTSQH